MPGRQLLDTNIVIELLRPVAQVAAFVEQAEAVFLPSIVVGELYFGAYKSGRPEENERRITDLAAHSAVLSPDVDTARRYGWIKNELQNRGRPIPENDIWIAAIAIQYDLELISRDVHFQEVPGLVTRSPAP